MVRVGAPIFVGTAIALAPVPPGLSAKAWLYFALFAAVIVGNITEPIPPSAVGLTGIILAAVGGLLHTSTASAVRWALSGFGDSTVWLIFAAYMFSLGYTKTGLGKRIALLLIRSMGKRTLGLGYAIAFADLALAPLMPSSTARSGGTIFPVIRNIPELYGSRPHEESARKIGAYLMYTALATTGVTSCMFLTALAPNVLVVALAAQTIHVTISWFDWFKGFAPAGVLLFALVPLLIYKIYPPEIKDSPEAPSWASDELGKMGPVTRKQITLLALVITALVLWIGAAKYIDATMAAISIVVLMVFLGVVSWNDVVGNAQAWDVLVWFATLVTLASGLVESKIVDWVVQSLAPLYSGLGNTQAMVLLAGTFFFLHYLFASITAHASALFPVFIVAAVAIPGASPAGSALLLAYTMGLMHILTPYAAGPTPIYYGSGYFRPRDFWILGVILGSVFFLAYVVITVPWLAILKI